MKKKNKEEKKCVICKQPIIEDREKWVHLKDFDCAKVLHNAGHYAQALFWAHLTLEKLCKALWIKTNESNTPPFIHNLLKIAL